MPFVETKRWRRKRRHSRLSSCALDAEIGLPQCETGLGSARGDRGAFVAPFGVTPIGVDKTFSQSPLLAPCQLRHLALR
jgi:hypothetical protein